MKLYTQCFRRRAASPTMRDAIQGMLSMSRMTGPSPLTMGGASPFIDTKPKTTIRLQREQREARGQKRKYTYNDDTGESMPTCFKDEEYGKFVGICLAQNVNRECILRFSHQGRSLVTHLSE